ncbi:hypothetical protein C4565_01825 [Candidatus Parcubacteria bacterium]|jgi:hypothetical protein|nr:MAG: hypothetical protein C4565_01825 [Candidatus Parcubacteria bacterium]
MKQPKNDSKYIWTTHAWEKMLQYGISEQRVKRIIRFPKRVEEGVLDGAIAGMQPSGKQEMWVMYVLFDENQKGISNNEFQNSKRQKEKKNEKSLDNIQSFLGGNNKRFKIITVWRYPGVSPVRDAIPDEVLAEIRGLI